jgi:hypothetical protein
MQLPALLLSVLLASLLVGLYRPASGPTHTEGNMPGIESVKDQVNVRLSDNAIAILHALTEYYGISQAAVFEMLLRDKARAEGIRPDPLVHTTTGTARKRAIAAAKARKGIDLPKGDQRPHKR